MKAQVHFTGTEIAYLHICQRKLWLFHHGIRLESENTNVQIGKFIQQTTFTRHEKRKEIALGNMGVVDWAELDKGIIHEIKKGKAPANAEDAQVRYYMWWMHRHGIDIHTGVIHYPKQKRTRSISWSSEMENMVAEDLKKAAEVVSATMPPKFEPMNICGNCAYQEFCLV